MTRRLRLAVRGAVQGVGFRPFVCRLAREMGVSGWVLNGSAGLVVEAESDAGLLEAFSERLLKERPENAAVSAVETTWLEPAGYSGFAIRESSAEEPKSAWILPDLATCAECRAEIADFKQRRYRYGFTNCTRCGPRFTIVTALPYDRASTTMAGFTMCARCAHEYEDVADRRFHAQPIACGKCGPKVWLDEGGGRGPEGHAALEKAAALIEAEMIVALKGIGGFLLLCDARSPSAVARLRERKRREEKPFAVLFPSLEAVRACCETTELEEGWLLSPQAPIVLLRRRADAPVAPEVAPRNAWLGAMLPYSPLHHLLAARLGFPVVATSGNLSEEPILIDNEEAKAGLGAIADAFLLHDRPIARHADDSIVRRVRGRQAVLRRARGLAPLPIPVARPLAPVLALGAQLKSAVSIGWERQIATSQHLGDLESPRCIEAFERAIRDLTRMYEFKPERVAVDLHPDYHSTRHGEALGLPVTRVQHHHAHVAACMAEHGIDAPVLGVAFDGLGYGTDGSLWGGEFLQVAEDGFRRVGHLRTFRLPGGEKAIREPRRAALGLLHEAGLDLERLRSLFDEGQWDALRRLPGAQRLSPVTSSAGRLFDAVAAISGLQAINRFEGQAAMALEHAAEGRATEDSYPIALTGGGPWIVDWAPMIQAVLEDLDRGAPVELISARFHNALAEAVVRVARSAGLERVVLSGGVFQNARLTERTASLLEAGGFKVFTPRRLPSNDGGISTGQAYLAGLGWGTAERDYVSGDSR